jgi:crossover junction endodeoxyribonuclease RusA
MIEITLPFPPTVNTYWRKWQNRMVISEKGRAYRAEVLREVLLNFPTVRLTKPLKVEIKAYRPDKRVRDLDNLPKAVFDGFTFAKFWDDDSQIHDFRIYWADEIGGMIKLKIEEIDDKEKIPFNNA